MQQPRTCTSDIPGYLIVVGYGEVGANMARLLRTRSPSVPLVLAGRRPDAGAALAAALGNAECVQVDATEPNPLGAITRPLAAVITAVNDPHDYVLLDGVSRGIPVLDIARWTERVRRASDKLIGKQLRAPVVFGSAWMAGLVSIVSRAAGSLIGQADTIDIDILYALADRSGPNSIEYMDRLSLPFTVSARGKSRTVHPISGGHLAPFSGARPVRTYRIDTPEPLGIIEFLRSHGVQVSVS